MILCLLCWLRLQKWTHTVDFVFLHVDDTRNEILSLYSSLTVDRSVALYANVYSETVQPPSLCWEDLSVLGVLLA